MWPDSNYAFAIVADFLLGKLRYISPIFIVICDICSCDKFTISLSLERPYIYIFFSLLECLGWLVEERGQADGRGGVEGGVQLGVVSRERDGGEGVRMSGREAVNMQILCRKTFNKLNSFSLMGGKRAGVSAA